MVLILRKTDIILQQKLSIIIRSAVLTTEHVCELTIVEFMKLKFANPG